METMAIAVGIPCIIVILVWVWKAINWVWFKPKKLEKCLRQQGLKGSSYRFLLGDLKDSSKMRRAAREKPIPYTNDYFYRLQPFEHQLVNKYGKGYFTWMGPIPVMNITEPQQIRDVLSRMHDFRRPKLNPLINLLVPGLISSEDEKWAKHRKLINPAFQLEKIKLMLPAFCISTLETIESWEKMVSKTGSIDIDVFPYFTSLSGDAISRAAFGSSYGEGRRIFELLREQTDLALHLLQSLYIPGWSYVPTTNNKRMKKLDSDIKILLKGIIEKRQKEMDEGEAAKNDLLGVLMESNNKATKGLGISKQHGGMSFDEMIDECKLFYFAGQETTSVLLVWTMILLAKHQDWQERAREEVLAIFGHNQPDLDELHQLKVMTMILHEVLRLYPPVTSFSRKVYDHEQKLGDITIPPGTMLSLSMIHAHHDPKLWGEDAKEFKPERFAQGIAKATKGNIAFFPFGWGPRICLGQNFSTLEVKVAMSLILQRFSFELSPSYAHAPIRVLTLQPQFGAHVILRSLQGRQY